MPLQIPQLDDRSFEQLFAEAKARIPVHTSEWTNFNDSDPGITVVQLFAFMTENLLYRSNRIPEANRLKFLKLLNIPLRPASPGRGLVVFRNDKGPIQPLPFALGLELRAGKVPFRTRTGVCILPVAAYAFYKQPQPNLDATTKQDYQSRYQTLLDSDADQLQFYKSMPLDVPKIGKPPPVVDLADNVGLNGTIDRSLWVALAGPPNVAADSVREVIAGQTLSIGIYPAPQCQGLTLEPLSYASAQVINPGLVFEIAAPDPNVQVGLAPPKYTRLGVEYAENVLDQPGIVQVTLPEYDKLVLWNFDSEEEGTSDYPPLVEDKKLSSRIVTWIRIRLPKDQDQAASGDGGRLKQQARVTWVGVNAARVIQAVPVVNERLGVGTGTPDQVFKVANTPVILDTMTKAAPRETPPGAFILEVQNENGGWDPWDRIDDLYAAKLTDKVYSLDPESGLVSFGSGLRGMRPPYGRTIRVSYEFGGGVQGQVAIGAINKAPALPGGYMVENPVATYGADVGEDTVKGEHNIPRYLQHRDRLVTANDFRNITLRTPSVDIGRVEVLPLFNPNLFDPNLPNQTWAGTVTVLVIPRFDSEQPDAPRPDRLFLKAVCGWLDSRRLVTTEVYVRGPDYVPIWVSVGIATMPGQVRELMYRDVQAAIRDYLSPLVGGPPVQGASAPDSICPDPTATTLQKRCPEPRGVGWQLGVEVRRQDLEAVATRVPGVRYVDSIQLGVQGADGTTLTGVEKVSIGGLQLPRLMICHVREGSSEDLGAMVGQVTTTQPNLVPVPVIADKC